MSLVSLATLEDLFDAASFSITALWDLIVITSDMFEQATFCSTGFITAVLLTLRSSLFLRFRRVFFGDST